MWTPPSSLNLTRTVSTESGYTLPVARVHDSQSISANGNDSRETSKVGSTTIDGEPQDVHTDACNVWHNDEPCNCGRG